MNLFRLLSRPFAPLRQLPLPPLPPLPRPIAAAAQQFRPHVDVFEGPTSGMSGPRASRRLSPNDLGVVPQNQNAQGTTQACGTTALASLMSYFGRPTTHEQIDGEVRPFDFGSAATDLVAYANSHGMRAQVKNGASLDDLARMIDQGVPPMVLIDQDGGSNTTTHYVTITGYTRHPDGSINMLVIADTNGEPGSAAGQRRTMTAAAFDAQWGNIKFSGINTGQSREMICVVPARGAVVGPDGVSRDAASIELPRSSLRDELRAEPIHQLESGINQLGLAVQSARDEVKSVVSQVRDFFRGLF